MNLLYIIPVAAGFATLCLCKAASATGTTGAIGLRCEYVANPLGIDDVQPRLSWMLKGDSRGLGQSAYQVLVASSPDTLKKQIGDLWDTGKVASDQSIQLAYAGKPLTSQMRCYWKVKVWTRLSTDQAGETETETAWSESAMWTMGLLSAEDWEAEWIGLDRVFLPNIKTVKGQTAHLSYDEASWIWIPYGSPTESAPVGTYHFRRNVELPQGRKVKSATAMFSADNSFTFWVNGKQLAQRRDWGVQKECDLSGALLPGTNILAVRATNDGGGPNPAGLIGIVRITFESGPPLIVITDGEWKVAYRVEADWQNAGSLDDTWKNVKDLGKYGIAPWRKPANGVGRSSDGKHYLPCPHLRKEFKVSGPVSHASLFVSAQGLAEMYLNGKRVDDEYFTPGWTDYHKRIYYRTYDVTALLMQGPNAVGGILGDGWYRGNISILGQNKYGSTIRLLTQLQIDYVDGHRETITSDPSWKASYGPILEADMQAGESYDARREIPGWDLPGFDDAAWDPVVTGSRIKPLVQSYPGDPVRVTQTLKTVHISEPTPGNYVFDLGQNFSGWIRLKVSGAAGDKVVMRFAEMLNADGTAYTANLRSARATDTYILKGFGEEIWEPRFTFHGFRYVQITGLPGKPTPGTVTGIVVHSDAAMTSAFECSNPLLNQLHRNIVWGQRSNYLEVPTDCPQRDERLGWTGDTQVFIRTGTYNQDVAAFFTKWIVDLMDTQNGAGTFGNQAPVFHGYGSPAWADAGIICPWTIYKVYGDTRLIETHYDAMTRFIGYCRAKGLEGGGGGFGDWLAIGSSTPKELISTAYFAYVTHLMAEMAEALGKKEDATKFQALFTEISVHFRKRFVREDGRITGESQTAYCLALHFNLLSAEQRLQAADHLVERIKARNFHLDVGFVGVSILLPTLTEIGRSDLAFRLIQNKTYPSWGYSIEQGATTIWERWNSYTKEHGFGDANMNSFNHYAYGACGEWMFGSMLGIESDGVAFKKITLKPELGKGVTWARGHYDSIHGRISSDWALDGERFIWQVTVPPNTSATVYVPATTATDVTENGKPIARAEGVTFLHLKDDRAVFHVDSGSFSFASKHDPREANTD
ncbi:MAG: family 78 glycoside hydrolase catalytic domain [Verrucomicrobia bacterium]|nr:family 78 glycoside hydrolase catalytic domain [Verrucomicrobiota bacterium]